MTISKTDRRSLPGREGEPVFAAPWQAEAFAIVVQVSRAGLFTWSEWVETLCDEIAHSPQTADVDADTAYYKQWLAALERLLTTRAILTPQEISELVEHWRRSYLHTPDGEPVILRRDWSEISDDAPSVDGHDHDTRLRREPVAISVANRY